MNEYYYNKCNIDALTSGRLEVSGMNYPMKLVKDIQTLRKFMGKVFLFVLSVLSFPSNVWGFTKDEANYFLEIPPVKEIIAKYEKEDISTDTPAYDISGGFKKAVIFENITANAIRNIKLKDFDSALIQLKEVSKMKIKFFFVTIKNYELNFLIAEIYEYRGDIKLMKIYYYRYLSNLTKDIPKPYSVYLKDNIYYQRIVDKFNEYGIKVPKGFFRIKIDFIDLAIKTMYICIFILLIGLFGWMLSLLGIDIPVFDFSKPKEKFYQHLNMTDNTMNLFKRQYGNFIQGTQYKKVDLVDNLESSLEEKNVKRYLPKKLIMETKKAIELIKRFNEGQMNLNEGKNIFNKVTNNLDRILLQYKVISDKYTK